tara:strand:- start:458 stop:1114 length:657 start_codon:yes stop_codon:yes gene_type:complete
MVKKKSKNERRLEKELIYILGFMMLLVIVFLMASSIFKSFNNFDYEGLTFTKEKLGEIPIFHYYYYFTNQQGKLIQYNLYLRIDPRENNIPIGGDEIFMEQKKVIFITSNPDSELNSCRYGLLGVSNLAKFLSENEYSVSGGNIEEEDAEENEQTHVNCETHTKNPVIKITQGNESKISIEGYCYEVVVAKCDDFLAATEKLTLQIIIDAKERVEVKN